MNQSKEKSAVGAATPATDRENDFNNIISDSGEKIKMLEVTKLRHHPDNPRKNIGDITELTDSIRKNGIMQNLTVIPKDDVYWVLIGNRRFEAAVAAGMTRLPCKVVTDLTPAQQLGIMLEENMQRNDLTVIEQAQGFQLMLDFGETVKTVAEKTGFSEKTVRHRLNIAKLDMNLLSEKSKEWQLTISDLTELEKLKDINVRNKVLKRATDSKNLKWMIEAELREEKRNANEKIYRAMFKKAKIPFDDKAKNHLWSSGNEVVKTYDLNSKVAEKFNFKITDDLIFTIYFNTIYVLRKKANKKKELTEQEKKQQQIKANCKQVSVIFKALINEMRLFLEQNIIEKSSGLMGGGTFCSDRELRFAWDTLMYARGSAVISDFVPLFIEKEFHEVNEEDRKIAKNKLRRVPVALQIAYSVVKKAEFCSLPIDRYNGNYIEDNAKGYDDLYKLIRGWGFRFPEDKEKEYEGILDGSSDLYTKDGDKNA